MLRRKILGRTASVAVMGQGYVGLSLACAAAEAGFPVVGVDVDQARVGDLVKGVLSVAGVPERVFTSAVGTKRLTFAGDSSAIESADIVCICVPTPLRDNGPDLSFIESACKQVSERLRAGSLVVLESTTYPGTTEGPAKEGLEQSGLVAGRDFLLAYSPERIDPGNQEFDFDLIPRIVGGLTPESTEAAALFYAQLVQKVVEVSSCRAAELAKLLENTFRHVNIALVNEVAMICNEIDIDVWEVIDAAATKPFGFMPFFPGPGVGGHCIPVDPTYLAWQVKRDVGHQFRILEQAEDINSQMPKYVATRIGDALNEAGKSVNGSKILILGVAYKPNVGDVRESPALKVLGHLKRRGAQIEFHDPYISEVEVNGASYQGSSLSQRGVAEADIVALLTPHDAYDLDWLAEHAKLVFDASNAFGPARTQNVVRL